MIAVLSGIVRLAGQRDYSGMAAGWAPGGAQDRYSCALGNLLLGNARTAGALECAVAPARFVAEAACRIVVGGAPVAVRIDGSPRSRWEVLDVVAGSVIELVPSGVGCRSYLCVGGGLGRTEGDPAGRYRMGKALSPAVPGRVPFVEDRRWEPAPGELRILPGPEFSDAARAGLVAGSWLVSRQSSGMGVVLEGTPIEMEGHDLLSAPVQDGTVQATGGGLVALLRERGTLGGYPRVATVIDCDVDRLAQLLPGNRVSFRLISREEAARLCALQEEALRSLVDTDTASA